MGFFKKIKKGIKKAFNGVKKVFKKIVKSKIFWAAVVVVVAIYAPQIAAWAGNLGAAPAATGSAAIQAGAGSASATGLSGAVSAGVTGSAQTAALTTAAGAAGGAGTALAAVPAAAGGASTGFSLGGIAAGLGDVAAWVGANQWAVPVMTSALGAGLTQKAEQDAAEDAQKRFDKNTNVGGTGTGEFGKREDFSRQDIPDYRGVASDLRQSADRGDTETAATRRDMTSVRRQSTPLSNSMTEGVA